MLRWNIHLGSMIITSGLISIGIGYLMHTITLLNVTWYLTGALVTLGGANLIKYERRPAK